MDRKTLTRRVPENIPESTKSKFLEVTKEFVAALFKHFFVVNVHLIKDLQNVPVSIRKCYEVKDEPGQYYAISWHKETGEFTYWHSDDRPRLLKPKEDRPKDDDGLDLVIYNSNLIERFKRDIRIAAAADPEVGKFVFDDLITQN